MKKLSLFSLFALLAFVAMPIYAEENDVYFDENYIVVMQDDVEDATTEEVIADENISNEIEENEIVLAVEEEPIIEGITDLEEDLVLIPAVYGSDALVKNAGNVNSSGLNPLILALVGGLGFIAWILVYLLFVYFCLLPISQWEVYRKADKKGWAWLVPFWGTMVYSEIAGMSKWLGLLPWLSTICTYFVGVLPTNVYSILLIVFSIFTLIWLIVANYRIARRYGWSIFPSILHALIIFCPITTVVLGIGNYKYQGKSEEVREV